MTETSLNTPLAEAIGAINSPTFTTHLMHLIELLCPFDCAVVMGFNGDQRPIYLYDSIKNHRDLLFQRYLVSSFKDDPFYTQLRAIKEQGIYLLKEVAQNNLLFQDYCAQFYHQTGWKDELCMLVNIEADRWVAFYLGYVDEIQQFSSESIRRLESHFTIIQALCQQHWRQSEFRLAEPLLDVTSYSGQMRQLIEHGLSSFGQDLLTNREQTIAGLMVQGLDTKLIAKRLDIAEGTVKNHRKRIYAQLNIASLSELFQLFLNHLITLSRS